MTLSGTGPSVASRASTASRSAAASGRLGEGVGLRVDGRDAQLVPHPRRPRREGTSRPRRRRPARRRAACRARRRRRPRARAPPRAAAGLRERQELRVRVLQRGAGAPTLVHAGQTPRAARGRVGPGTQRPRLRDAQLLGVELGQPQPCAVPCAATSCAPSALSPGYRFGTTRTLQPGLSGCAPGGRPSASTSGGRRASCPRRTGRAGRRAAVHEDVRRQRAAPGRALRPGLTATSSPECASVRREDTAGPHRSPRPDTLWRLRHRADSVLHRSRSRPVPGVSFFRLIPAALAAALLLLPTSARGVRVERARVAGGPRSGPRPARRRPLDDVPAAGRARRLPGARADLAGGARRRLRGAHRPGRRAVRGLGGRSSATRRRTPPSAAPRPSPRSRSGSAERSACRCAPAARCGRCAPS